MNPEKREVIYNKTLFTNCRGTSTLSINSCLKHVYLPTAFTNSSRTWSKQLNLSPEIKPYFDVFLISPSTRQCFVFWICSGFYLWESNLIFQKWELKNDARVFLSLLTLLPQLFGNNDDKTRRGLEHHIWGRGTRNLGWDKRDLNSLLSGLFCNDLEPPHQDLAKVSTWKRIYKNINKNQ